ncbi:MAG: hypothetical protein LJE70_12685 [Chromatiaceae bacterium]|nr:hypothetical protein [Chromatiaceae bacterium]
MTLDLPRSFLLAVTTLALPSCGGGLVAPEGPQSDAFRNQLSANCGKLSIGN